MGKVSPHGFTTQAEYDKWYRTVNLERIRERNRRYYREHREEISRRGKERRRLNKKPRERVKNTWSSKFVYKIMDGEVEEYRSIAEAAEELYISTKTIDYAVKKNNGYNQMLGCHFIISKEKLSSEEANNKLKGCESI